MTQEAPRNPFKALVAAFSAALEARLLSRVAEAHRQRHAALAAVQAETDTASACSIENQNRAA